MFRAIKPWVIGSLLALLIFLVISFVTILVQMPPFEYTGHFSRYIGFPLSYYDQFWLSDECRPHHGWNVRNLTIDAVFTWALVMGVYMLFKARGLKHSNEQPTRHPPLLKGGKPH